VSFTTTALLPGQDIRQHAEHQDDSDGHEDKGPIVPVALRPLGLADGPGTNQATFAHVNPAVLGEGVQEPLAQLVLGPLDGLLAERLR
jgi:hypothetical protein